MLIPLRNLLVVIMLIQAFYFYGEVMQLHETEFWANHCLFVNLQMSLAFLVFL